MAKQTMDCGCCGATFTTFEGFYLHVDQMIRSTVHSLNIQEDHVRMHCECPDCATLRRIFRQTSS